MKKEQEFTVLRTFNTSGEAEVMKALLDSAGIDNFIKNEVTSGVLTMLNESVGIKLMIRTEDVNKAQEFLKAEPERRQRASSQDEK